MQPIGEQPIERWDLMFAVQGDKTLVYLMKFHRSTPPTDVHCSLPKEMVVSKNILKADPQLGLL